MILLFGIFSFLKKKFLAAFIEAAEVTHHAAFFKTDGLAAFRALFAHQAVFCFVGLGRVFPGHIAILKDAGNGIRYGQHQAAVLKNRILAANAF